MKIINVHQVTSNKKRTIARMRLILYNKVLSALKVEVGDFVGCWLTKEGDILLKKVSD